MILAVFFEPIQDAWDAFSGFGNDSLLLVGGDLMVIMWWMLTATVVIIALALMFKSYRKVTAKFDPETAGRIAGRKWRMQNAEEKGAFGRGGWHPSSRAYARAKGRRGFGNRTYRKKHGFRPAKFFNQ